MVPKLRKEDVRKLIGQEVHALKKDGSTVSGKLVRITGSTLMLSPKTTKSVQTKAVIPLVLFDLLAIGTSPFAFGASPFGFGASPFGFGNPGFFW